MSRVEVIGDATLYLGDAMDILPTLQQVAAVVTDPPYGINENQKKILSRSNAAAAKDYGAFEWDKELPSPALMELVLAAGKWKCIFGGNYFGLPASSCWLVWDKLNTGDFADCELAWTNWPKAVRRIQWRWNGFTRQVSSRADEERFHPTQKPVEVMAWALDLCPKSTWVIDPFMGSGTTGVAQALRRGHFIGIERDQRYFDVTCRRIEAAYNQRPLFDAESVKLPEQLGIEATGA